MWVKLYNVVGTRCFINLERVESITITEDEVLVKFEGTEIEEEFDCAECKALIEYLEQNSMKREKVDGV
jgi:hypothetical protein